MESDTDAEDDPHLDYEGFEEQMDNFWKDESPDQENYFDEDGEEEGGVEGLEGLTKEEEEEVEKILDEEEDALMAEEVARIQKHGEKDAEKIILDKMNIDQLINMVSRVRLAWPENLPGYDEAEFSTDPLRAKYRESFYHNTDKEKTALWYAENFRRQYHQQFPKRRALVIAPPNECACQKLFSTFLNPAVLGYPEFLDAQTCSAYLKEFFAPEIMEHPTRYPHRIRSHVTVLKNRKVNCFEFAIVLASFLIGVGYDAYVVDGYASEAVVYNDATEDYIEAPEIPDDAAVLIKAPKKEKPKADDENKSKFDFLSDLFNQEEEEEVVERPTSPSKYRFKKAVEAPATVEGEVPPTEGDHQEDDHDHFHEEEEEDEGVSMETGAQTGDEEPTEEEDEIEEEEEGEEIPIKKRKRPEWPDCPEKYYGMRTHAWVLIKAGAREVDSPYFIEPFSGNKMEIEDENFFGVETVFNHKNFWVSHEDPMELYAGELNWDLEDSSKWSKMLVEAEKKKTIDDSQIDSLFQDEEDDIPKKMELLFDMPVSFTPDPIIPQEDYERKYPGGKKTFNYNNAVVELAAPYVNEDGMVKKVLKFSGKKRNPEDLEWIEEKFENRKDKLIRRKWIREGRMLYEYFGKGRKDALKEHVHISGKNKPTYPRDLYYYANAHPHGVSHRKVSRKEIVEHYEGRDDLLYYRLTRYGSVLCDDMKKTSGGDQTVSTSKAKQFLDMLKGNSPGKKRVRRKISTIVEKYYRDQSKEVSEDIAEKHMQISEGLLRILFHYGEGNISRKSLEFFKTKGINPEIADFHPEDCNEYLPDPRAEPLDVYRKFKLLQRLETDQRISRVLAAQTEEEIFETVSDRVQEDFKHELDADAFAGEKTRELVNLREKNAGNTEEGQVNLEEVDIATPFFERFGVPRNKMEEVLLKKRIMLNAKVRLIKKAHNIKESYEREASHLSEKVKWYDRHLNKMGPGQEEDFNKMYKERLFEMHVMERRLIRHQELASEKYYKILFQVLKHPHLNKFSNKKVPPPVTPPPELSEEEKARLAALAIKMKDCCQFYTVKYTEPKKPNEKGAKKQVGDGDNAKNASEIALVVEPETPTQEVSVIGK